MVELTARVAIESLLRATDDDATPIIRRLARIQARAFLDEAPTPPTLSEDLREVLEFYADRDSDGYRVDVTNYGLSTEEGEIVRDGGARARAALNARGGA